MNVRLIDIDSRIPNLALMQISAYYKAQGDEVVFDQAWFAGDAPDRVYISCIFDWNAPKARGIGTMFPDAVVSIGGSGVNYDRLPEAMQKIRPDYYLYPSEYALGFTSRGCIRDCEFCIVRTKEGPWKAWQHVREFADPRFDTVVMLDNNILANKRWFFEQTDWLLANKKKVDFKQGLDVRLLDDEIAERLKALKWAANIRFAFDSINDEPAVMHGIALLKAAGIDIKHNVSFFVLAGYPEATVSAEEDAIYRCNRLRGAGTNAYVMRYARSPKLNALARWANDRRPYWKTPFANYTRKAIA